jgi:hypothetical protein
VFVALGEGRHHQVGVSMPKTSRTETRRSGRIC